MSILTLDDRDSSVRYTGSWRRGGTRGLEYDGTTMRADGGQDSFATVTFTGSRISVIGTIGAGDKQASSYTVDTLEGNKVTLFELPDIAPDIFYNVTFFQSDALSPTSQHTLVIQPVHDRLYIDSFAIVQVTLSSPSPSSDTSQPSFSTLQSSPSSSSSSPTLSFATKPSLLFSPATSSDASPGSSPASSLTHLSSSLGATVGAITATQGKSEVPIGAIIGGALGALAIICIFLLLLLHLRQRRREDHSHANQCTPFSPGPRNPSHLLTTPYDISTSTIGSQRDRKRQIFVGTRTGTRVSTAPSSSGNMTVVSHGAGPSSSSGDGNPVHDPPPLYHG